MQEEIDSLITNNTWILTQLLWGRTAIDGKWVYKVKRGPQGEISRYKARWVVGGFQQRKGIDYSETFASLVKLMSCKSIFALAVVKNWEVHPMDVKTAFLYRLIEGEVYVRQPTGFEHQSGDVCNLRQALYGLKQSPRVWYDILVAFLKSHGLKALNAGLSVFVKPSLIVTVYVDDLQITGSFLTEIHAVKQGLSERFHISDLGLCQYHLGMTVTRDRKNQF